MTARGGQHSDIAIHLYMLIRHYKVIKCEIQASEVLQGWEGNDGWVAPTANTREIANLDRYIADVARDIDNLATQEDTESGGTFSSYLAGQKYLLLHYWHSTTINLPLKVSG